jgi:hypothetical protein
MAAKKKATRGARQEKPRAEDAAAQQAPNRLVGAVYHNGKLYDHTKAADQRAFAALVEKEGLAEISETDPKKRAEQHKARLQSLADTGAIRGYGTKAAAKKGQVGDEGEGTLTLTEEQALEQKAEEEA